VVNITKTLIGLDCTYTPAPKKWFRLWLLWWSGFPDEPEAILENVWQNDFSCWIEV
jgi:hypothetical protein